MERHTYSINFSACKSKARKTGLVPINVSITLNGERVTFTTGKYIQPAMWDTTKQRARGSSETSQAINDSLQQIRNRIYQKETELMNRGYIVNASTLRDAYLDKMESIQGKTLCQIFEEYIVEARKSIDIDVKRDDFALQELNHDFIEKFNLYLKSDLKHKKNTATTRHKERCVNVYS